MQGNGVKWVRLGVRREPYEAFSEALCAKNSLLVYRMEIRCKNRLLVYGRSRSEVSKHKTRVYSLEMS